MYLVNQNDTVPFGDGNEHMAVLILVSFDAHGEARRGIYRYEIIRR
jgi:hypothetical protein